MTRHRLLPLPMLLALAACASAPPASTTAPFDAPAAVAAIRAAGAAADTELVVRPLGAREVDDLAERARELEARGDPAGAAAALDHALEITPDDPVLLQARAEAALLLGEPDLAARLASRAIATGTEVGPQCRQHWETLVQVERLRQGNAGNGAADAGALARAIAQRDACTVAGVPRY